MKKTKIILFCLCTILFLSSCNDLLFVENKENVEICNHSWATKVTDGSVLIDGETVSVNSKCTITTYCTKCGESHTEYKDPCIQLEYSEDGIVSIGSYESGEIVIPSKAIIGEREIPIVQTSSFYVPKGNHPNIRELYLNESIELISKSCFRNCYRLEKITIPSNAVVEKDAFANCTGLSSVTFLDKVSVGTCSFGTCTALKEVISLKELDVVKENPEAFQNCYLIVDDD